MMKYYFSKKIFPILLMISISGSNSREAKKFSIFPLLNLPQNIQRLIGQINPSKPASDIPSIPEAERRLDTINPTNSFYNNKSQKNIDSKVVHLSVDNIQRSIVFITNRRSEAFDSQLKEKSQHVPLPTLLNNRNQDSDNIFQPSQRLHQKLKIDPSQNPQKKLAKPLTPEEKDIVINRIVNPPNFWKENKILSTLQIENTNRSNGFPLYAENELITTPINNDNQISQSLSQIVLTTENKNDQTKIASEDNLNDINNNIFVIPNTDRQNISQTRTSKSSAKIVHIKKTETTPEKFIIIPSVRLYDKERLNFNLKSPPKPDFKSDGTYSAEETNDNDTSPLSVRALSRVSLNMKDTLSTSREENFLGEETLSHSQELGSKISDVTLKLQDQYQQQRRQHQQQQQQQFQPNQQQHKRSHQEQQKQEQQLQQNKQSLHKQQTQRQQLQQLYHEKQQRSRQEQEEQQQTDQRLKLQQKQWQNQEQQSHQLSQQVRQQKWEQQHRELQSQQQQQQQQQQNHLNQELQEDKPLQHQHNSQQLLQKPHHRHHQPQQHHRLQQHQGLFLTPQRETPNKNFLSDTRGNSATQSSHLKSALVNVQLPLEDTLGESSPTLSNNSLGKVKPNMVKEAKVASHFADNMTHKSKSQPKGTSTNFVASPLDSPSVLKINPISVIKPELVQNVNFIEHINNRFKHSSLASLPRPSFETSEEDGQHHYEFTELENVDFRDPINNRFKHTPVASSLESFSVTNEVERQPNNEFTARQNLDFGVGVNNKLNDLSAPGTLQSSDTNEEINQHSNEFTFIPDLPQPFAYTSENIFEEINNNLFDFPSNTYKTSDSDSSSYQLEEDEIYAPTYSRLDHSSEHGREEKIQKKRTTEPLYCGNHEDGYFPDVEANCEVFYLCYEGRSATFECSPGTAFSRRHQVCVWPDSMICGE